MCFLIKYQKHWIYYTWILNEINQKLQNINFSLKFKAFLAFLFIINIAWVINNTSMLHYIVISLLTLFLWKNMDDFKDFLMKEWYKYGSFEFFFNMLIFFQLKILVWRKWILKVIITRKFFITFGDEC